MHQPNPEPPLDPILWQERIEATGPASLLVVIGQRMGPALRARMTSEDVWQETLLHAWRDRYSVQWQGVEKFRRWLLQVAENRIRDLLDREHAARRGAGREPGALPSSTDPEATYALGCSTTPSRIAARSEQARTMELALQALPSHLGEVVRLRLFEELRLEEVAERLGIGLSAVKHRFREGAARYRGLLEQALGSSRTPTAGS